jgi:hypothetical protein
MIRPVYYGFKNYFSFSLRNYPRSAKIKFRDIRPLKYAGTYYLTCDLHCFCSELYVFGSDERCGVSFTRDFVQYAASPMRHAWYITTCVYEPYLRSAAGNQVLNIVW